MGHVHGLFLSQKWQEDHDKMREKLLSLIGKIGRDAKIPRTTSQVGIAIFRHKPIEGQF